MTIGFRGKLFLGSLVVILTLIVASGAYLGGGIKSWFERRIESELLAHVKLARQIVEGISHDGSTHAWNSMADSISAAVDARVTIVASDGTVLGDSELSVDDVANIENHKQRPEIIAAQRNGWGSSRRYSTTIGTYMLYVAVPYRKTGSEGVIRVSRSLVEVNSVINRLKVLLLVAGAIGLMASVVASWFITGWVSRLLLEVTEGARALAAGEGHRRIIPRSRDELGSLAGSFNQIAEELEKSITALTSERDRFEAVLEGMSEAVIAVNDDQHITLVNQAAVRLIGLNDSPIGSSLLEVIRAPALGQLVNDSLEGRSTAGEFDLAGEKQLRLLARVTPMDITGGAVVVLLDVSDLRRLEKVRQDFISNVSHELRTPVSVIRANAETLLDGAMEEPEHAGKFLQNIMKDAERLSNLVSDLLELSRIESSTFVPEVTPISISDAVASSMRLVYESASRRGHTIQTEIPESYYVLADPQALEQILHNLLDNAVKYIDDDGRIEVRASSEDGTILIEVEDDGPGIEHRHRERIFERFYRIDEGRSREKGGTGLGLSIVRNLAESMNGEVGYRPAPSGGAIFWVRLPAPTR